MGQSTPGPGQPYLFISYASADREWAMAIAAALERNGVSIWIDHSGIAGGASWAEEIVEAVRSSTLVAVLCSPTSMASRNVRQELQLAWDGGKDILPLLLEPVEFPAAMAYFLDGRQWIDLALRPESAWLPEVIAALRRLGIRTAPFTLSESPLAPPPLLNTPSFANQLIGREGELDEIVSNLVQGPVRLITLTGPGGVGKTRLAVEAAQHLSSSFPGGVKFVDLASVTNPEQVASAIALTLGIKEHAERPIRSILGSAMAARRRSLLLLDNFEQVIEAAALISELLAGAPELHILVTSRERLRILGEREIPVLPLQLPAMSSDQPYADVSSNPAVALFVSAAAQVRPGFTISEDNASAVVGICQRLDGLPLAIELAATRVRLFPPALLLTHLEQRLPVLTGGQRDRPTRQQTLKNTIAWSYDLLPVEEQALFRLIASFASGASFEAIESVMRESRTVDLDLMSGLSSLVDKSLVREAAVSDGAPRFSMLETVREFALNASSGHPSDAEKIAQAHAHHFLKLALAVSQNFQAVISTFEALDSIHPEIENVRLAIRWFAGHGDSECLARFAIALWGYFYSRGLYVECNDLCEAALQSGLDPPSLPAGLHGGVLAVRSHMTTLLGNPERGELIGRASLEFLSQSQDEPPLVPLAPLSLVIALREQGKFVEAMSIAEHGRDVCRRMGNKVTEVHMTHLMGRLAYLLDDLDLATLTLEESLNRSRELGAEALTLFSAQALSIVLMRRGQVSEAAMLLLESELLLRQGGFEGAMAGEIAQAAVVIAARTNQYTKSALLLGFTSTNAASFGLVMFDDPDVAKTKALLQQQLGDSEFTAAYSQGSSLSAVESVAVMHEVLNRASGLQAA